MKNHDFGEVLQRRWSLYDSVEGMFDEELSGRLTAAVRPLHPDFKKVLMVVKRDDDDPTYHTHSINATPPILTKDVISVDCSKFAYTALNVVSNDSLKELRQGLEMIVHHELGHHRVPKKIGKMVEINGRIFHTGATEIMAQVYALVKAKNPIKGMAAMLAMQEYLQPSGLVQHMREEFMEHWGEAELMRDLGIPYSFPLRENAVQDVIRQASVYVPMLERHIRPLTTTQVSQFA